MQGNYEEDYDDFMDEMAGQYDPVPQKPQLQQQQQAQHQPPETQPTEEK
jgi:hypothetical protein